jgi:hypothetical protein
LRDEAMASNEGRETLQGFRYDVRYREPGGRPRVKTWRRKADAVRFARSVEVDKDRGLALGAAVVADQRAYLGRSPQLLGPTVPLSGALGGA